MINYFEWPQKKILVTSLRLDTQNPRLTESGKKITQPEIINYLIEHEKVIDLAKGIARQGYFLNEQPIVYKEGDKFIVLEGNRRVTACKILINPDLVKSNGKRKVVKALTEDFDISLIAKLNVFVAPSREEADIMIVNRHRGGSIIEKWDVTKHDRFLHNRYIGGEKIEVMAQKFAMPKSEVKKSLQRFNVFSEMNKLDIEEKYKSVLQGEVKFNMTNVERVYDSKYGRDFLGIEFDENGQVIKKLPVEEYNKRLKKVVEEVIKGKINSRTLNTEGEKKVYFEKLINSSEFNKAIKPDVKYNKDYIIKDEEAEEVVIEPSSSSKTRKGAVPAIKLFAQELSFITKNKRIDDIFEELKRLNLKNTSNAVAVLLRSYIDMVTYQFMKKKNGITELLKIEGEKQNNDNAKKVAGIKQYMLELGIKESKIEETRIQKSAKLKGSLNSDFIPSLRYMLDYLAKSDLITEPKLKASLSSYITKGNTIDKVIGHNEFNLLVHNEYYTNDADELKSAWNKLEPILEYMVNEINS